MYIVGSLLCKHEDKWPGRNTEASISVISKQTSRETLKSTHTYTGEEIKVVGGIHVSVEYNNQKAILKAIVLAVNTLNCGEGTGQRK